MKTITIAEIGLNFAYGEDKTKFIENAKKLIDIAKLSGFDYVKFQKRNPDLSVPEHQKNKNKKVPWRKEETTYLQYKKDIEFSFDEYVELFTYAHYKEIGIFASVWDLDSVELMSNLQTKLPFFSEKENGIMLKIPSAHLTNFELIKKAREKADILLLSTGMSTEKQIEKAIEICNPDVVFHTNSTYPAQEEELNLNYISYLKSKWPEIIIGYSGHEFGLTTTFAAVVLGAEVIERHITLERTLWGSDQMASVEPIGQFKLIKGIRKLESALGNGGPRQILPSEMTKLNSLRI